MSRRISPDLIAAAGLTALWLLFFWRIFTPVSADQASLKQGDFSGQFVAFAAYQYERFSQGEIPLWNPYNNGGLPFIADTQAAVFYPPRLATIALAGFSGGWRYRALEIEMTVHVLAYTLFTYALVRRMTLSQPGSIIGGFTAAIITGYSGFTTGYAPLQLAILEAGIWLPLSVLGIWEATRHRFRWAWLLLTGSALGISWLAGHPQTSFFITYLLIVVLGWRVWKRRYPLIVWVIGCSVFGLTAFGLAAVQLIPGAEYLSLTTRTGFGYDAKANGFPVQDIVQFIFPGVVSLYSPLYVGIAGLVLAMIAIYRRIENAWFWAIVALFALIWSFGANAALFPALYNTLPGLRFFRGQERAALVVMNALAILAGLAACHLASWDAVRNYATSLRIRMWLYRLLAASAFVGVIILVAWLGSPQTYGPVINPIAFSILMVGVVAFLLPTLLMRGLTSRLLWSVPLVLAFDLFSTNMDSPATYDPVPAESQISMNAPALLDTIVTDQNLPFRVDGFRGIRENYGSLYGIQDIRGISPLFLNTAWQIIESDLRHQRAWELFAVRYVISDWNELPVDSTIVDSGEDALGNVNVHLLSDPRPFAVVLYRYYVEPNSESAINLLRDPGIDPRRLLIMAKDVGVTTNDDAPLYTPAEVTRYEPERIVINASSESDAILSVSLVHYPGWRAYVNGVETEIVQAYGALSAVRIPAGNSTIELIYDSLAFRIGAVLSVGTIVFLIMSGLGLYVLNKRTSTVGHGA